MKKITYIISDIDKALAFEWIVEEINRSRFELSFILLNPGPSVLEEWLKQKNIAVHRIRCRGKKDWFSAWMQLKKILRKWRPDAVHCHLLQANILGLSAARRTGIEKRIYTRHHGSLHHVYHRKGIFWDRFANKRGTHVVAISSVVKKILTDWEKVPAEKVVLIPHGFRLAEFETVSPERINAVREKYNVLPNIPIIGVIARLTEWKGVQYVIPAFQTLLKDHPDAILMLFNANGDYKGPILKLLEQLPEKNYRIIPFEKDIPAVYKIFSVYIHTPVDDHSEAFGQTYVEALAAGVPSVFTMSGIANDFIRDGRNALTVPFRNSEAIATAIRKLLADTQLSSALAAQGKRDVHQDFGLQKMVSSLENLYDG